MPPVDGGDKHSLGADAGFEFRGAIGYRPIDQKGGRNAAPQTRDCCPGVFGWAAMASAADDRATPEEVVAKVRAAAGYIATEGEAGLSLFNDARSDYVWKDSYVFVWDCAADKVVAIRSPPTAA
jgi:hypothetical protein